MPLSVAGARPPAPSSGLQAFRLLTPVSSANAAASVTNPAAFVTHTTASVTHTTACVTNAAVSELIEAQAVICCRARQQKVPPPNPNAINHQPAVRGGGGRGVGGPCTVLLSRPAINTVRIALSPRTMHQQPQFPGHPLQKRPRPRRYRHHGQPILLVQPAHHRQNRLHRSRTGLLENPLHQPEILPIDPPRRRPLIPQRRLHHLRHLCWNNVRHHGNQPRAAHAEHPQRHSIVARINLKPLRCLA